MTDAVATALLSAQAFPTGTVAGGVLFELVSSDGTVVSTQTVSSADVDTQAAVSFTSVAAGTYSVRATRLDGAGGALATPVASDLFTVAITVRTSQWGAWQPYMSATWSYPTAGYTKLTFALKPTAANQRWQIRFIGVGDVPLANACNLDVLKYGPAPVAGVWATYTIPLADLCVLGKPVYKVRDPGSDWAR